MCTATGMAPRWFWSLTVTWSRKLSGSSHCYGSTPLAPFTGSRQGGVSHDCARPFRTSKFRRRAGSRIEPCPHISSQCNGEVTWQPRVCHALRHMQRDGCGHRGAVPVPRAHWPGAEQGFMVAGQHGARARDLPDHRTLPPSPSRSTPAGGRALRTHIHHSCHAWRCTGACSLIVGL